MANTTTYNLIKPTVGASQNTWGGNLNDNFDDIDDLLDGTTAIKPNLDEGLFKIGGAAVTSTAAELNLLDGVTATTTELNLIDGVTSTTAELNILDGVTATAAEINHVGGVTSAIQTQITNLSNNKQDNLTNIADATSANGYGTRTVSSSAPSGGSDGDVWYVVS